MVVNGALNRRSPGLFISGVDERLGGVLASPSALDQLFRTPAGTQHERKWTEASPGDGRNGRTDYCTGHFPIAAGNRFSSNRSQNLPEHDSPSRTDDLSPRERMAAQAVPTEALANSPNHRWEIPPTCAQVNGSRFIFPGNLQLA